MSVQDVSDTIRDFLADIGVPGVRVSCENAGDGFVLVRGFNTTVRKHTLEFQGVKYVTVAIQPLLNEFQRRGWTANSRGPNQDDLIVRTM